VFAEDALTYFKSRANLPGIASVIVVAVPRPGHTVTFDLESGSLEAVVPPTFAYNTEVAAEAERGLLAGPLAEGARVERARAPAESLATRLGLAVYGRNNIAYLPGRGSYHQLIAYVTDAKVTGEAATEPTEPRLSAECADCRACLKACPTGAISSGRFVIRAERCLTYFNEYHRPWPDWLQPSVHHCLIGCLACQEKCPQNKGRLTIAAISVPGDIESLAEDPGHEPDRSGPAVKGAGQDDGRPPLGNNRECSLLFGLRAGGRAYRLRSVEGRPPALTRCLARELLRPPHRAQAGRSDG